MLRSSLGACVVLLLVACGCNGSARERSAGPPVTVNPPTGSGSAPAGSGSSGTPMSTTSPVTVLATVTASQPGRPPLQRLTLDVTITNPGDAPRWITLAKQIPHNEDADGGGVDALEVRGQGAALLGSFRGIAGVHALRVAGHATVKLTNLPVGWWRTGPADAVPGLDIVVADDLTIGGAPAKAWFGVDPLLADGATVDGGGNGTDAHTTDGPEAMIALVGAHASSTALTLPKP